MLMSVIDTHVALFAVISVLRPDDKTVKAESVTEVINFVELLFVHKIKNLADYICVDISLNVQFFN